MACAYFTVEAERGELRELALPARGAGELRVRARYGGISRGTELLVHRGQVPPGEYARMRAPHQQGDFPWPVKYGYSLVGEVIEADADSPIEVGATVFALHPHQDELLLPAAALYRVPPGVPARRAVLAANAETALNGLWDAGLGAGDRVSVVGGGVVGALCAWLAASHPGVRVELVDVDAGRAALAGALGVDFAQPADACTGRDLVVHASGQPEGLRTALSLAGREATVLELSWYGQREVSLPLGGAFHSQRLRLVSSQVGSLPAARRARWDHRQRLELALSLLTDDRLDALLSEPAPFSQLPAVMNELASGARAGLCQVIQYSRGE